MVHDLRCRSMCRSEAGDCCCLEDAFSCPILSRIRARGLWLSGQRHAAFAQHCHMHACVHSMRRCWLALRACYALNPAVAPNVVRSAPAVQDPCQEVAHTCQLALQRIEFFKAAEAAHQAAAAADPNATGAWGVQARAQGGSMGAVERMLCGVVSLAGCPAAAAAETVAAKFLPWLSAVLSVRPCGQPTGS